MQNVMLYYTPSLLFVTKEKHNIKRIPVLGVGPLLCKSFFSERKKGKKHLWATSSPKSDNEKVNGHDGSHIIITG